MKGLIHAYLFFLVFEGALRKWVFQDLSDILLLIRDPTVLAIYALALMKGRFPVNGWVVSLLGISLASGLVSFVFGDANWKVIAYGVRTACLHMPLAWVIPRVLAPDDCYRIGRYALWIVPGMTLIMVSQFFAPSDSWINLAPGGLEDVGIMGAKGRFRPPGTFSFVTGVAQFFALATAFYLSIFFHRKLIDNRLLAIVIAAFLILALPISISRLTAISSGLVLVTAIIASFLTKRASRGVVPAGLALVSAMVVLNFLAVFDEAVDTFNERWVASTEISEGGVGGTFSSRVMGPIVGGGSAVFYAPLWGYGIGLGTNVGANLSGGSTFGLGENEWQRILFEMGVFLGSALIVWRVLLTVYLLRFALRGASQGNVYGLIFFAATAPNVLLAQWGQPTTLGFAAVGTGLTFALGSAHRRKSKTSGKDAVSDSLSEGGIAPKTTPAEKS